MLGSIPAAAFKGQEIVGTYAGEVLAGGRGDDTITSGGGRDLVHFDADRGGHDVVTDIEVGPDGKLDALRIVKGDIKTTLDDVADFKAFAQAANGGGNGTTVTADGNNLVFDFGREPRAASWDGFAPARVPERPADVARYYSSLMIRNLRLLAGNPPVRSEQLSSRGWARL